MVRPLVFILLVVMVILPVIGCNGSSEESTPTVEATPTPTPTPTLTPTPTPTPTKTPTPTVPPPSTPIETLIYEYTYWDKQVMLECYHEDYAIGQLLESSEEFRAFYEAEREKITEPICWTQSIPFTWMDAVSFLLPINSENRFFISANRIPLFVDDAFWIAHQLRLFTKMIDEGFPMVVPTRTGAYADESDVAEVALMLNYMFVFPLCHAGLESYGFNLVESYERLINSTIAMFEQPSQFGMPYAFRYGFFRYKFLFATVQSILYLEDVLGKANEGPNEVQLWLEAHEPTIADELDEILSLIREIGYDTPEKAKLSYKAILDRYNQHDSLYIDYLSNS